MCPQCHLPYIWYDVVSFRIFLENSVRLFIIYIYNYKSGVSVQVSGLFDSFFFKLKRNPQMSQKKIDFLSDNTAICVRNHFRICYD